jgi:Predicted membrane protein
MKKDKLLKRCIVLVIGLFIMAIGVALSIKANLGTSPVSCVPYIYSLAFPITVGVLSIIVNVLIILLQIVVLRKEYQLIQLVQLPVALIFGFFIDFAMLLLSGLQSSNYIYQWILCLLSCVIIAFGVFLEVKANVTYLAGEGLSIAISKAFNKEFGKAKVGVDASLVIIGVASSFILLHRLEGIREGTIAAALLVGTIARFYNKNFKFIDSLVGIDKKKSANKSAQLVRKRRLLLPLPVSLVVVVTKLEKS